MLSSTVVVGAADARGIMYLYRDGSVVVECRYSESGSTNFSNYDASYERAVYYDFSEKTTRITFKEYTRIPRSALYGSGADSGESVLRIVYSQRAEGNALRGEVTAHYEVAFETATARSAVKAATDGPIVIIVDPETLVLRMFGRVAVEAIGAAVEQVSGALASVRTWVEWEISYHNLTGVQIEKLVSSFDGGRGFVEFSATVHLAEALRSAPDTVAQLRRVAAEARYPAVIAYEMGATIAKDYANLSLYVDASVEENVNVLLKHFPTFASAVRILFSAPFMPYSGPRFMDLLDAVTNFAHTFEAKPSSGHYKLSYTVRNGMYTAVLEIRTPRMAKVGAASPSETLAEIYRLLRDVTRLPASTILALVPEKGVVTLLHGKPVSEVHIEDLPYLQVLVGAPPIVPVPTPTPELSPSPTPPPSPTPTPTPVRETSTPWTTETVGVELPITIIAVAVPVAVVAVLAAKLLAKKH